MSLIDDLIKIVSDLPEEDRARALFDLLLAGITGGKIIAFMEHGELIYRHVEHCTGVEIAARIDPEEIEKQHDELIRQLKAGMN
jgi:hypothetical protein